jgi:hypothetical protein
VPGANRNNYGRKRERARAQTASGASHTRGANGSSLWARTTGRGQNSGADLKCVRRREGADGGRRLPGARSKHCIGRTTSAFCDHLHQICKLQHTVDLKKRKRNCDHLQWIWIFHCILKSFIYYGGKLCLHTWLVDTRFMQIPSKTTSKQ